MRPRQLPLYRRNGNLSRLIRELAVAKAFELIAGHPALDLVNTLDWRFRESGAADLLKSYDDLLRFTQESGMLKPAQIRQLREAPGARALQRCIELREAIAEILYAKLDGRSPTPASVKTLERSIKAARLQQQLHWKEGQLEWQWRENDAGLPLWTLSLSAVDLMLSEDIHRLRACDNPECRWLFLDTSKNHTRRWCDMEVCGNRMKARRFKAQRKTSER
jgi:predicted RNA-binding Zn ribbon-like protein